MSRHERRADAAHVRRMRGSVVTTHLIAAGDRKLENEPELRDAIRNFIASAASRGAICICCQSKFSAKSMPDAFLLATAGGITSASGICHRCWRDEPDAEIEMAALRTLRKMVGPHAHFEDASP